HVAQVRLLDGEGGAQLVQGVGLGGHLLGALQRLEHGLLARLLAPDPLVDGLGLAAQLARLARGHGTLPGARREVHYIRGPAREAPGGDCSRRAAGGSAMAKKRSRERRPRGDLDGGLEPADGERPELAAARRGAERRRALAGEFLRYCVVSGLLLVFAPGLGAIVAFFWGLGLARRGYAEIVAPELERRWTDRELERSGRDWRELDAWSARHEQESLQVGLRLGDLVETALAPRAESLAGNGVALVREDGAEASVKGD